MCGEGRRGRPSHDEPADLPSLRLDRGVLPYLSGRLPSASACVRCLQGRGRVGGSGRGSARRLLSSSDHPLQDIGLEKQHEHNQDEDLRLLCCVWLPARLWRAQSARRMSPSRILAGLERSGGMFGRLRRSQHRIKLQRGSDVIGSHPPVPRAPHLHSVLRLSSSTRTDDRSPR